MKKEPVHEIAQRYCSRVDANVVLAKINADVNEPPQYRCLSSHLCDGDCGDGCKNNAEPKKSGLPE